jgi:asparagine synthase (glutamine-hydrolysing)
MCGLVGIAALEPVRDNDLLVAQRDTMCHRGPDDAGIWWSDDNRVGLAHRRLAIIDLTSAGHQPMADISGDLHIVLNGEIYNYRELRATLAGMGHRFRSQSDTEVILEAYREWGADCVTRFIGMFAFAIHDAPRRRVFIARDRAGEKPLFYRLAGGQLSFASELKALLRDPRAPRVMDAEALDHYLAYGHVPSPHCLLAGYRKLPPAHVMEFDLTTGDLEVRRYWSLPESHRGLAADPESLQHELEELLADAVARQLVADVPVGVLLSGGLDSSLITAFAARASSSPVRTFTISFPGHGNYDEGPYARIVASHFGTRHTDLVAEPATVSLLPELARQFDEPIADSSMVPTYLVSKLVRGECTVALGGDGGDELFGGYHQYSYMLRQQRVHRRVPAPARRAIAGVARQLPVGVRGRTYLMSLGAGQTESLTYANIHFDSVTRRRLSPALAGLRTLSPEAFRSAGNPADATTLQRMTRADFSTYLPEDILVKVDRASMLSSLEVRAPFLDHRVIEFAFSRLADSQRATADHKKVLLRALGRHVLPSALELNRKQGFSLPLAAWFKGEWGTFMEDVLRSAPRELFDAKAVDGLIAGQRRGLSNVHRLFGLTQLELWRREFGVSVPRGQP